MDAPANGSPRELGPSVVGGAGARSRVARQDATPAHAGAPDAVARQVAREGRGARERRREIRWRRRDREQRAGPRVQEAEPRKIKRVRLRHADQIRLRVARREARRRPRQRARAAAQRARHAVEREARYGRPGHGPDRVAARPAAVGAPAAAGAPASPPFIVSPCSSGLLAAPGLLLAAPGSKR